MNLKIKLIDTIRRKKWQENLWTEQTDSSNTEVCDIASPTSVLVLVYLYNNQKLDKIKKYI